MCIYWPSDLVVTQNKYFQIYILLMTTARVRFHPVSKYLEKHHIVPDCFFVDRSRPGKPGWIQGDPNVPENIVLLTAKEHYIAHRLLCKFLTGIAQKKMTYALWFMSQRSTSWILPSRVYESLQTSINNWNKEPKGKLPKPRKPNSVESNIKRSLALKGRKRPEMVGKPSWNAGKKLTETQVAALRVPKGPMSEENKASKRGPRGPLKKPRNSKPRGPYKKKNHTPSIGQSLGDHQQLNQLLIWSRPSG